MGLRGDSRGLGTRRRPAHLIALALAASLGALVAPRAARATAGAPPPPRTEATVDPAGARPAPAPAEPQGRRPSPEGRAGGAGRAAGEPEEARATGSAAGEGAAPPREATVPPAETAATERISREERSHPAPGAAAPPAAHAPAPPARGAATERLSHERRPGPAADAEPPSASAAAPPARGAATEPLSHERRPGPAADAEPPSASAAAPPARGAATEPLSHERRPGPAADAEPPSASAAAPPARGAATEPLSHAQRPHPAAGAAAPPAVHAQAPHRPEIVIKTILALLGLVGLAYLGGHPKVQEWEARLRISQVITAGFPFVVLGILARHPAAGIVTEPVLAEMQTLLGIALGWMGLAAGFRFDGRLLGGLPRGAARAAALATSIPFAFVAALTGAALLSLCGRGVLPALRDPAFLRDALVLGTAGAMSAKASTRLLRPAEPSPLARVIRLEELAGIAGLAVVSAYFRPHAEVTWQLPGTAWLLLGIGLGATVGIVSCAILESSDHGRPEFVVLALGTVSFAAGLAGHLHLSPTVITFIAGVFLANFPGRYNARLGAALRRLERPVHLLSLFAIGALWDVHDWRGWLLMPLFMAARLAGKRVAAGAIARGTALSVGEGERRALAVAPMGPLAIAIVVNAQLLHPGGSVSLIASAVVGGAVLTEVAVQLLGHGAPDRAARSGVAAVPAPPALAGEDEAREGSREASG